MNSSDFFRAHWSRHLCFKSISRPVSLYIYVHQQQEMNSSDFFRAHWSRHLCCKALVDRQAHVQPTSPSIYLEGISSLITLSPSLVDPALVSVVREVDGQETGLSVQPAEKKNRLQTGQDFIYRAHWPRLLCF